MAASNILPRERDLFILDVRDAEEFEKKNIEGSFNIPHRMILVSELPGSIGFYIKKIPKDKTILLFCDSGKRARMVERTLLKNGFNILNILTYEHAEDFVNCLRKVSDSVI